MRCILIFFIFFSTSEAKFLYNEDNSMIEWIGKKLTGQHNGNINPSQVNLDIFSRTDNTLSVSGTITIDMNTISNIDIESEQSRGYLIEHLKSDDFFDVENYPYAYLEIIDCIRLDETKISDKHNYIITGKLMIKGISHQIEIPTFIDAIKFGDLYYVTADGSISIDRTLYNIKYKSKNYFPDIGDKLIYDDFTINFQIHGTY